MEVVSVVPPSAVYERQIVTPDVLRSNCSTLRVVCIGRQPLSDWSCRPAPYSTLIPVSAQVLCGAPWRSGS